MKLKFEKMKNNSPKLRFKEFTDQWQEKKLGDIGENIIGLTYSPKDVTSDGEYPVVLRSSNVQKGELDYKDIVRVSTKIPEKLFVKIGDILICTRNGSQRLIGKNTIIKKVDVPATFGAFMSVYRSKHNNFLSHLFETDSYDNQIQMNLGARINQITTGYLNAFKFYIPSDQEQEKIAGYLTVVVEKINMLELKKKAFEKYKKGIMQAIFSQKIRFKKPDGLNYPDWEEKKLGDTGNIVTGTTPATAIKEYYDGIYPWVTPTDIGDEKDIYSSTKLLTEKGMKAGRLIPKNSLLVTCIASIGKNAILKVDGSCNQQINAITPNPKNNVDYLYYLLEANKNSLIRFAGAGGMLMLNKNDFSKIKFMIASSEEQAKIAEFLSALDEKINLINNQLEQTKLFKKSLLQRMFV